MAERLSEQIEALQKRNGGFGNFLSGVWQDELTPLIAAAREQEKELAAMKEQHSTDLRDVAEMAIHGCKRSVEKLCDYPTADSILAEFREKKAKVRT